MRLPDSQTRGISWMLDAEPRFDFLMLYSRHLNIPCILFLNVRATHCLKKKKKIREGEKGLDMFYKPFQCLKPKWESYLSALEAECCIGSYDVFQPLKNIKPTWLEWSLLLPKPARWKAVMFSLLWPCICSPQINEFSWDVSCGILGYSLPSVLVSAIFTVCIISLFCFLSDSISCSPFLLCPDLSVKIVLCLFHGLMWHHIFPTD